MTTCLGVVALAALAVWLWPRSASAPPAASTPFRQGGPAQQVGALPEVSGLHERAAARVASRVALILRVQDASSRAVAGAHARVRNKHEVLAESNAEGVLALSPRPAATIELEVSADGYWPAFAIVGDLSDDGVITLRPRLGHSLSLQIVKSSGEPVADVLVKLTPALTSAQKSARETKTDSSGWARLRGLKPGKYGVALYVGQFEVSGFVQEPEVAIVVPSPETQWAIHMPSIVWVKPSFGKIVTGYSRVPVGQSDFGRLHAVLRKIEQQCEEVDQGSFARAFMSPCEEVDFVGLLDPGGWMIVPVMAQALNQELAPIDISNDGLDAISYGTVTVEALSVDGAQMDGVPFALHMASASQYGSFTIPIQFNRPQKLPTGEYVFVGLQAGAAKLFDGPRHSIKVGKDGEVAVKLHATREIRNVELRIAQETSDGVDLSDVGIIRITDGSGFDTETRPAVVNSIWLPTSQPLEARTRCRNGITHVDLHCDFFVPSAGEDHVVVKLIEQQ